MLWMWKQDSYWDILQAAAAFADASPVEPVGFDALTFWFSARRGWGRCFGAWMLMKWCFLGTCILENQTNKQLYWVSQSIHSVPYSNMPFPQNPGAFWVVQGAVCAQCSWEQCEGVPDSTAEHLVTVSRGAWCCVHGWERALCLRRCLPVAGSADMLCLLTACSWHLSWGVPRGPTEDKKDSVCCCLDSE